MLSRSAKQELIDQFSEAFKANPSVMVVEYKGLSVSEMEGLRQNLQEAEAELKVVKNSLLKIASKDTEIEKISELFVGPTAVAICKNDPTSVAKVFVKSAKDLPSLLIKGGIVDGNVVNEVQIADISKLPSRVEMIAQLLGMLSTPMSNFVGALTQMQTKLLYALTALKEAKTGEESEPEANETQSETAEPKSDKTEKEEAKVDAPEPEGDEPDKQEKADEKASARAEAQEKDAEPESEKEAKAEAAPEQEETVDDGPADGNEASESDETESEDKD